VGTEKEAAEGVVQEEKVMQLLLASALGILLIASCGQLKR
jgi:hypothetical protein